MNHSNLSELQRYQRQTILNEVGSSGQKNLSQAKVLCIGVGGLGSASTLYLAAAGVGHIGLVDADTVSWHNLQRQILFTEQDHNLLKVNAGQKRLQTLNSQIEVVSYAEMFNHTNADQLVKGYDLLLDGSDNFATKFLLNQVAYKNNIPLVYAAVNGFDAQVAFFWGNQGACYQCLFPNYPQAAIKNCAENGVLGSIVGVAGTLQASLALNYLISRPNFEHPLFPKVGQLNFLQLSGTFSHHSWQVPRQPHCPVCSQPQANIHYTTFSNMCTQNKIVNRSASEVKFICDQQPKDYIFIDVRDDQEWQSQHIEHALHWPLHKILNGDFPKLSQANWVVYCQSGFRSQQACQILSKHFANPIINMQDGFNGWQQC